MTYAIEVRNGNDPDVCEACQEIADKVFLVKTAPKLPYEKCTSEYGCRCFSVPALTEHLYFNTEEEIEAENWYSEEDRQEALREWHKQNQSESKSTKKSLIDRLLGR